MKKILASLAVAVAATFGAASAAPLAVALGNNGATLVKFDTTGFASISGIPIVGAEIDVLDFRPATGELWGYSNATSAFYLIDITTGVATQMATFGSGTQTRVLGLDWNPTIDKLRLVTEGNRNIVYDPATNGISTANELAYAIGDVNEGADPAVVANAYTRSFAGNLGGTTEQYAIDFDKDSLLTLANNAGTLDTIAELSLNGAPVDILSNAGLDFFFGGNGDTLFALLQQFDSLALYTISLATGELTLIDTYTGSFGSLTGLAIAAPIPLPGAALLFGTGIGAIILRRAKKKTAAVAA